LPAVLGAVFELGGGALGTTAERHDECAANTPARRTSG
jgi:hypothetical protein